MTSLARAAFLPLGLAGLLLASAASAQSPAASPPPSAAPAEPSAEPAHPAHIHTGTCAELGDIVAPLTDVTYPEGGTVQGSVTDVDLTLDEMLASPHAIMAHESAEALGTYIACADLAEPRLTPVTLMVQLTEQGGSGFSGVAVLRASDASTNVTITLMAPATGSGGRAFAPLHPLPAGFNRVGPPTMRIRPRSDRLENRREVFPFALGHCGLSSPVDIDGSLWDAIGANDAAGGPIDSDEVGELVNETAGAAILVGPRRMDFRTRRGSVIVFARHQGAGRYQPCA